MNVLGKKKIVLLGMMSQVPRGQDRSIGMSLAQLKQLYGTAALLINLHGGTVPLPEHSATGRLVHLGRIRLITKSRYTTDRRKRWISWRSIAPFSPRV